MTTITVEGEELTAEQLELIKGAGPAPLAPNPYIPAAVEAAIAAVTGGAAAHAVSGGAAALGAQVGAGMARLAPNPNQ
jgi:hypothetical protein